MWINLESAEFWYGFIAGIVSFFLLVFFGLKWLLNDDEKRVLKYKEEQARKSKAEIKVEFPIKK